LEDGQSGPAVGNNGFIGAELQELLAQTFGNFHPKRILNIIPSYFQAKVHPRNPVSPSTRSFLP